MSAVIRSHSKTLDPADLSLWLNKYVALYDDLKALMPHAEDHYYRRWEYAIILDAIQSVFGQAKPAILEVGGGGSLFAPLACTLGYPVTVVDPDSRTRLAYEQNLRIASVRPKITVALTDYLDEDWQGYDIIVALSVIEHVPEWEGFFIKMLEESQRFIGLTTDFDPEGRRLSTDHLRSYSDDDLLSLMQMLSLHHYRLLGNPDWRRPRHAVINGYTFASFCAVRSNDPLDLPGQSAIPEALPEPDRIPDQQRPKRIPRASRVAGG